MLPRYLSRLDYGNEDNVQYTHDASGTPMTVTWNGTVYYYVTNLQGDVVSIIDSGGTSVANYYYNAWGQTSAGSSELGRLNPLRYRGYVYDIETELYYLQSRYYNPKLCRFISPDNVDLLGANGDFASYNLFAYCGNNPVSRRDTAGTVWETVLDFVSLGASVVEVAINPTDIWAWAGLVGDVVDLIPFVTGVGEIARVVKTTAKVADQVDDVVDAAKTLRRTSDAASNLKKSTGTYEVLYSSGKNYVGKGGLNRAITSAMEHAKPNKLNNMLGDSVVSIRWKMAPNNSVAFAEEFALQTIRGVNSPFTYNKIWSPGRKLIFK